MGFDVLRAPVATQRLRSRITLFALPRPPAAHTCRTHLEPFTDSAMPQTTGNSCQNTSAKSKRQGFRQVCPPPPADSVNHHSPDLKTPLDSFGSNAALEQLSGP